MKTYIKIDLKFEEVSFKELLIFTYFD